MFKLLLVTLVALCGLSQAAVVDKEFVSGFESGILLRNKKELIQEQYNCPKPVKAKGLELLDNLIPTMKAMSMMIPDAKVQAGVISVEMFIHDLVNLFGIFQDYDGSVYCKGAIFGSIGAATLMDIYEAVMPIVTKI